MAPTDHLLISARWIEASLLGSIATMVAVIAVGIAGLAMLSGRLDVRRGLGVVIGCFVLFGAPTIANGLLGLAPEQTSSPPNLPLPPPLPTPMAKPATYDPYAGAAVPRSR